MAAKYERLIEVACDPQRAFGLAQEALKQANLKLKSADSAAGVIEAEKGMSIFSFGHRIKIEVDREQARPPDASGLRVRSECKGFQMVDYGSNKWIVDRIEQNLGELVAAG